MAPPRTESCAWVLYLYPPAGTILCASMDLPSSTAVATLGGFAKGLIKNAAEIVVPHELPDTYSGIDIAGSVVLRLSNAPHVVTGAVPFDMSAEWRDVPGKLCHYDITNDVLLTELTGVITQADFTPSNATFTVRADGAGDLDQMIPVANAVIDTARFPKANDVGVPLPVYFGDGIGRPPVVGRDDEGSTSNAGGMDLGISAHGGTQVQGVFYDQDQDASTLEPGEAWTTGPGSPTRVTGTTFTVTGDQSLIYTTDYPMRWTNGGDPDTHYARIASYSSGTVTIADYDVVMAGTISNVAVVKDYFVEQARYSLDRSTPSDYITSMRVLAGNEAAAPVVAARYFNLSNPANAIREIIRNDVWALGKSYNTGSFNTAATQVASLGLTVNGCLAGDRQQRQARIVLNEMLYVARGRLWKDETSAWNITIDNAAPSAPTVTLGFADGVYNNVKRIESDTQTPLDQAASTMSLAYLRGARSRSNTRLIPADYGKTITKSCLSVGRPITITSPWIRDYATASKTLHYWTERTKAADRKITLVAGLDARQLRVGQNVYLIAPTQGLSTATAFTVGRLEKRLGDVRLRLHGYSSDIYSAVSGVSLEPNDPDLDTTRKAPGTGTNLIPNPDFSTRLKREGAPDPDLDTQILPGWELESNGSGSGAKISAITYTTDPLCVGGGYVTLTFVGSDADLAANRVGMRVAILDACRPIGEKELYMFSYYSDSGTGTRCENTWYDDLLNPVRIDECPHGIDERDINGKGWPRHYSMFRALPNSAVGFGGGVRVAFARPAILGATAGTVRIDGVQFELVTRPQYRASVWKRHSPVGWDPRRNQPGALTILPASATGGGDHGTEIDHRVYTVTLTNGASSIEVGTNALPGDAWITGVTVYVRTAVSFNSGGSKFRIGITGDPDAWGEISSLSVGTRTTNSDFSISGFPSLVDDTPLYITPDTGTFHTGVLVVTIGWIRSKAAAA